MFEWSGCLLGGETCLSAQEAKLGRMVIHVSLLEKV